MERKAKHKAQSKTKQMGKQQQKVGNNNKRAKLTQNTCATKTNK
jgi:hypothetical protein